MGNPTYRHSEIPAQEQADTSCVAGFWWRIDGELEKVLLCDLDPVGVVSLDVRNPRAQNRWAASISVGHVERGRFATQAEAIGFVEAAMPAYLRYHDSRRQHPVPLSHSTPARF